MRIADKMNYDQVNSGLQKNRNELSSLQNQAATQKRINKPSDDPLAATRVLAARTDIGSSQQYIKNINQAKTFLEFSDQSLGELTDILTRAKELAIAQSSDAGANDTTRKVTATEVEQLLGQAVQVANRKIGDRFLFGGFKTTNPPFSNNGEYKGDDGEIKIAINKEANVSMNVPGSRVFLGMNKRAPQVGAAVGATVDDSLVAPSAASKTGLKTRSGVEVRGPAGSGPESVASGKSENNEAESNQQNIGETWRNRGTNVFSVLSDFEVSLRANSKEGVQDTLERIDEAFAQVVLVRSEVGSRLATLNSANENLTKGVVDSKALASTLEDVDNFELVSDLNKSETTLKASLAASSKLIQPSLLDFLR